MIVLDSNVLSALMRPDLNAAIVAWADRQPADSLWTASVCVFEVHFGIETLPAGRRREMLAERFGRLVSRALQGRVLPLDRPASIEAAAIAARQRALGRPVEVSDVLIAGTVRVRNATLATRNVPHFEHAGVHVVNPWDAS